MKAGRIFLNLRKTKRKFIPRPGPVDKPNRPPLLSPIKHNTAFHQPKERRGTKEEEETKKIRGRAVGKIVNGSSLSLSLSLS